jgi:hypothetical protein
MIVARHEVPGKVSLERASFSASFASSAAKYRATGSGTLSFIGLFYSISWFCTIVADFTSRAGLNFSDFNHFLNTLFRGNLQLSPPIERSL